MNTWPKASRSSLRDCSIKKCGQRKVADVKTRTSPEMSVNTHIAGRSAKALSFAVRYMLAGPRIAILFSHSKVNNMYN